MFRSNTSMAFNPLTGANRDTDPIRFRRKSPTSPTDNGDKLTINDTSTSSKLDEPSLGSGLGVHLMSPNNAKRLSGFNLEDDTTCFPTTLVDSIREDGPHSTISVSLSSTSIGIDSGFSSEFNDNDSNSTDVGVAFKRSREDHAAELVVGRAKRLEFLLRQTEIFSHFMRPAYSKAFGDTKENDASNKALSDRSDASSSVSSESKSPKRRSHRINDKNYLKGLLVNARRQSSNGDSVEEKDDKPIECFDTTPSFIKNTKLRDYQIRGLNWLISLYENGINGILADEMGLGKTIQTIAILGYLLHYKNIRGPHLIILPLSTLSNWKREIERWCPSLKCVILHGDQEKRTHVIEKTLKKKKWNICLTTYDMTLREMKTLGRFNWIYLIIDEGQRVKNENSKLSQCVRLLKSTYRLLLTGTPLQNNLHELWALLNFLLPDVFNSDEDFDSWFDTDNCLGDNTMVNRLHGIVRPFLLRRIKSDVEKSLLPKKEIKIYVGLSKLQREWYRKVLLNDIMVRNSSGNLLKTTLNNILMQLRKVSNHPYIFREAEPGPPYTSGMHIVNTSGKMVVLDKLLTELMIEGSRILIFSQFKTMLDILEDYLFLKQWKYCRLDGSTNSEDREAGIDDFNKPGSDKFVYLLSTRAGGLGINLATADVVIIYDSDWNPQVDLQATDRCHRIGQTKQVRVFRLITENTVDEKIVERAEVKLHLDRKVIQQGRLIDTGNNAPKREELHKMIMYGAESIIASKASTVTDESIAEILARSKVRSDKLIEKLSAMEESSLRNFTLEDSAPLSTQAKVISVTAFPTYSCHDFEGVDYKALREERKMQEKQESLSLNGLRRGKMSHKKRSYSEVDSDSDSSSDVTKRTKTNKSPLIQID